MSRKVWASLSLLIAAILWSVLTATAQGPQPHGPEAAIGSGFTYQGQLKKNNGPVNELCTFTFSLWDAQGSGSPPTGGTKLGSDQSVPSVAVLNGLFTVQLNAGGQFGANAFDGSERWLQAAVQCASDGSPVTLTRQPLTAVPYALHARDAWSSGGNSGTSPAANFIGTADNQPLVFKTDNAEAMRLDSTGKLGIGTSAPSERLTVANGSAHIVGTTPSEGFEGVAFPPAGWTTGGNAPWVRDSTTFNQGVAAAASGTIADNQSSYLDLNYTYPSAGYLRFVWKVSSEYPYDPLLFCLDNDACTAASGYNQRISGVFDWTEVVVPVPAGPHSFRWVYSKDANNSLFSDKGWVDNVRIQTNGSLYVDGFAGIGTANPLNTLSVAGTSDFRGKVGIGVTNPVQLLHMNVITGDREGLEIDSPIAGHAPAIYLNHTGPGGRNYRLASFGDNINPGSFRIRDETAATDRFTIESTGRTSVNGVVSVYDNSARTFNAGVASEVYAQLIDFGINDDSANRFGGSYTSAAPGGFLRVDARGGGADLFQFLARPAGSSSPVVQVMGITADGKVGIGVPNPAYRLQLPNNADATGQGQANAWQTYSSRRYKSNITTIENALGKVEQLRGVTFDWNANGKRDIGLIAEEVGQVIPEIVNYEANGVDAQSLDYSRLVAVLIEATKAQQRQIEQQRSSLENIEREQAQQAAALKQQNAALEARLTALEQNGTTSHTPSALVSLDVAGALLSGNGMGVLALLGVMGLYVAQRRNTSRRN